MTYRCQHCSETVPDTQTRAAKETCYVSPNGRHRWVLAAPEEEQFDLLELPASLTPQDFYGD